MSSGQRIHVRDITIRYTYGGRLYRLKIPETSKVDALIFNREQAALLRGAQIMSEDDQDELRRLGKQHVPLHPGGEGWPGEPPLTDMLESLEDVGRAAWAAEHSMTDLCIHETDCMWFCLDP